jgi:hypothetical protein
VIQHDATGRPLWKKGLRRLGPSGAAWGYHDDLEMLDNCGSGRRWFPTLPVFHVNPVDLHVLTFYGFRASRVAPLSLQEFPGQSIGSMPTVLQSTLIAS